MHDAAYQRLCGNEFYRLLLAELWLKLESCELVGLLATSIKQQVTESKGKSTSLYLKHKEIGLTRVLQGSMGDIEASRRHRQGLAPIDSNPVASTRHTGSCGWLTFWTLLRQIHEWWANQQIV